MNKDSVTIFVAGAAIDDLAAYGAVLRFGQHHRTISACYPVSMYSIATVLMEGAIAALKKLRRPLNVTVVSCNGYELHSNLQNTAFNHLRGDLVLLDKIHLSITWESKPDSEEIGLCHAIALQAIEAYISAVEAVSPGLDFIRQAMDAFDVVPDTRIGVAKWLGKNDGVDEWGETVEISITP